MTLAFAFLAGVLSILSPCVLPLVPIVFGAAATQNRYGPLLLSAGVVVSFVVIGLFIATVGYSIGLDQDVFKTVAAVLMITIGTVLALPSLQMRVATAAGPAGNWAEQTFRGFSERGGQFGVGLLLGAVWVPCVGPTLGAAALMAAQGENIGHVAAVMTVFGIGAALPLAGLGVLSRQVIMRWRGNMMAASSKLKIALGLALVLTGLLILTGLYEDLSASLVESAPDWLNQLTTRF